MIIDKTVISQAAAGFAFMVSEAVLGKTRFGSWLGLAKAIVWFIFGAMASRLAKVAKLKFQTRENSMSGTVGTQSLLAVVDLGLDLILLGKDVAQDGIDIQDLGKVLSSVPSLISEGSAAYSGKDQVIPELKDLQLEESEAIVAHVMAKLMIEPGAATDVADKALKAGYAVYDLVGSVQKALTPVAAPPAA